jgi:hypothetical protein
MTRGALGHKRRPGLRRGNNAKGDRRNATDNDEGSIPPLHDYEQKTPPEPFGVQARIP